MPACISTGRVIYEMQNITAGNLSGGEVNTLYEVEDHSPWNL